MNKPTKEDVLDLIRDYVRERTQIDGSAPKEMHLSDSEIEALGFSADDIRSNPMCNIIFLGVQILPYPVAQRKKPGPVWLDEIKPGDPRLHNACGEEPKKVCPVCWGTGFYRGWGMPCSKGCKS